MPSVVIYVLSSQTGGSKSLGSATDANVNMERNLKDSVVCGVKGYAQGAPVESHMPAFRGMPSCNVAVVCSLFVHHMFPNSNCRVHAQVLSSHGGRLLPFHGWVSGGGIPVLASALAGARMA